MNERSRRIHLLLEGQTEEIVVRDVISPYLSTRGWWVSHSLVTTKRPAAGPAHKGGLSTWTKLDREIRLLLRDSSIGVLTTVLDYYGFPDGSPGMDSRPPCGALSRVEHVEHALAKAIGNERFLPFLVLHEIESWVYAAARQLGSLKGDPGLSARLLEDIRVAGGPELVNDGPNTAPSKRLGNYRPDYTKTIDGPRAIVDLGIDGLRGQCPHFERWLSHLDKLAPTS